MSIFVPEDPRLSGCPVQCPAHFVLVIPMMACFSPSGRKVMAQLRAHQEAETRWRSLARCAPWSQSALSRTSSIQLRPDDAPPPPSVLCGTAFAQMTPDTLAVIGGPSADLRTEADVPLSGGHATISSETVPPHVSVWLGVTGVVVFRSSEEITLCFGGTTTVTIQPQFVGPVGLSRSPHVSNRSTPRAVLEQAVSAGGFHDPRVHVIL